MLLVLFAFFCTKYIYKRDHFDREQCRNKQEVKDIYNSCKYLKKAVVAECLPSRIQNFVDLCIFVHY